MRRVVLAAILLSSSPLFAAAPAPAPRSELREVVDVRYHPGMDRHTLDIIAPATHLPGGRPVVLFVHGGTWMVGDKDFFGLYRGVGRFLARQGIVAVLINYRLSPMVRHPEHARDVARAFAWTVRNIGREGGDPRRIFLAGHSAGAHLASLVVTDPGYLTDPALKLSAADRDGVRGVVSVSGVYRVPTPEEFRVMASCIVENLVGTSEVGSFARFAGPILLRAGETLNPFHLVFGRDPQVQRLASPIVHVHRGLPPFLLLYAEREVPGLARMTGEFARALRETNNSVETHRIEGCSHRSIVSEMHSPTTDAGRAILQFVRRHSEATSSRVEVGMGNGS